MSQPGESNPTQLKSGLSVRELVEHSPLTLILCRPDGGFVACSRSWARLCPNSQRNKDLMAEHAADRDAQFARCRAGETAYTHPLPVFNADGERRWMRVELGPWTNTDGEVVYVVGHGSDVTEQEQARAALARSEERLTAALAMDRMIVKEIDYNTRETHVSSSCPDLEPYIAGQGFGVDHVAPDDRERMQALIEAARARVEGPPMRTEYRLNDPARTWVQTSSKMTFDADGKPELVLLVTQDISAAVRRRHEVERLAFTDALTGLPNRAKFQIEFDKAVADADASGRPLGLIMVDVDHFKDINDTLGHDAGDALLEVLAVHLRQAFRRDDVVARLGGDEFAILLRDAATEADLVRPLQALRDALAAPIQHNNQGFRISTSIGAALHSDPDADPAHLLKNADIALYQAKAAGRDQVVVFQPQMRSVVEQRLELLRDVRAAIPRGEFMLYYQPVVSIGDGAVVGFEALMRWNHPDHGVLPPAHFMAAFEDQDLSLQLGEVTIESSLQQMRAWIDEGLPFGRVSINLSTAQFRTGRLAQQLSARLDHWGVPADRLTVEVTENVYLGWGAEIVSQTVRALHDCGVTIALDDFGTGYASLANLRQFPIDRLKIDKSFVQNADDDAIVRAVINLGASMGMEVVAEGVEKPEQLSALSRYGCKHVQGYHFARPMPAGEVPGYLRSVSEAPAPASAA